MMAAYRLAPDAVPTVWRDARVIDLAAPDHEVVCFVEMANTLSKIARFNGRNFGIGLSVAQHCVMGAQAMLNEGATAFDAALFLLHDGHEWALGDVIRPTVDLYAAVLSDLYGETRLHDAIATCKAAWDEVIYFAAGLPGPEAWTNRQKKLVHDMDARLQRAEAIALFGPGAGAKFPVSASPKLTGAIRPWPAGRAEEQFLSMAHKLITEERVVDQANLAAMRRAL